MTVSFDRLGVGVGVGNCDFGREFDWPSANEPMNSAATIVRTIRVSMGKLKRFPVPAPNCKAKIEIISGIGRVLSRPT